MGREIRAIEVVVSLSRHNSKQDKTDNIRFDELRSKIVGLAEEYDDIDAMVL